MNPALKPLAWGGAAIAVGLALIALVRSGGPEMVELPAEAPRAPAAPVAVQERVASPGNGQAPLPPWLAGQNTAAAGAASRGLPPGTAVPTQAQLNQAVADIQRKVQQNERTADELLAQLDRLEASGALPPDINADALRSNLRLAKRSQTLARELAELANGNHDAAAEVRMKQIVAELQQLQSELRYDVRRGSAQAAAAPTIRAQGR